jgi:hypothetical protein
MGKIIKNFDKFILEEVEATEVKPKAPVTKPGTKEKPQPPSVIPDRPDSPVPAPAKAEFATAEDVVGEFIRLINKSGDDIKKYVEVK